MIAIAQENIPPPLPERQRKIRLRGVRKRFGSKEVLRGVDLDIAPGESIVVIGGSGAGKSVLLKCIIGLVHCDSGTIEVDGIDVSRLRTRTAWGPVRRKFGMLFQGAALFDSLCVWENVAFGLIQVQGMRRANARALALRGLARVGLGEDVASLFPSELSGGMKKRVGLARAMATDPEILFFDEPTTGLDPVMSDAINRLIVTCTREVGATAVSITHDMASARVIADRIAMLHDGRIVWDGAVNDIDRSGNPSVERFINGHADDLLLVPASAR